MKKRGMTPKQAEKLLFEKAENKGTNLRIVRVRRGMSQSELAEASGVPKKTIQRYEQEPYRIDSTKLETLCKLCEALECRISDIIDDEELLEKYNKVK